VSAVDAGRGPVGWIGLGAIGLPMAARAVEAGWEVWGFDPDPERQAAAERAGIHAAAGPAEAGRRAAPLVVCVVRSAAGVEDALLGEGGALRAGPGRLGLVMSTVGAEAMEGLAARARDLGALLDAPILGNPAAAAAGRLTIVASGHGGDVEAARPLLEAFATSVVDLGERPGAAQAMKLVSQLLQIVGMVATFEGMALAEGRGVREEAVLAVLRATAPSWTVEHWDYARELWERRDPATSLGLFAKDLAAAVADGASAGVALPLTEEALALLRTRMASGNCSMK
jgi:3-hydroxyisobutyrate dehydrogenase-like beta-hydroxyacid dehydrogenase